MRIAVTGGAGAIGSRVTARLAAQQLEVVALVRDVGRVRTPGVRATRVDYDDRPSLDAALQGVDRLVFIGSDGEADRMLLHHRNILDAARDAQVERIVLLSSQDADPASPFCYAHTYATTEQWLSSACPQPGVVRAGLYTEFFGRWVLEAARHGELALPLASGAVAPIARVDVADSLVAAVAGSLLPGPLVVTGTRCYAHEDLAGVASVLAGTPVRSRPCTAEEFAVRLVHAEPSPWWRYAYQTLFAAIEEGAFAQVTDTAGKLTGRVPLDFGTTLARLDQ